MAPLTPVPAPPAHDDQGGDALVATGVFARLGGREVLTDVSVRLQRGRRIAVVGPNGSGKTTLLRAMGGLLGLTAGAVRCGGRELGHLRRAELARLVAYMPQRLVTQFPLACLEAVLLGRSPHKRGLGLADEADIALARQAMAALGVWKLAERPVTAVSGGELQRLMFARVLVQDCTFLLLDEPTSAQDPRGRLRIQGVLDELAPRVGVLVAVHDLNLAFRFFDHVVLLKAGRILQQGAPAVVFESGALERAFGVRFRFLPDAELPALIEESLV